ncbi:hypothetical protein L3Q72_14990 [Vibrio sp. JC009]|uniref:hypothetical protein n=1 Tax=Vibrio sp. JC009 TaxID=2912314 RepID=UPI0023B1930B|nr:hypothetical protein [Vibrio sp. JC009]WED24188.1 hypothetical protein L3Q72_14990 [Vibrio sp. JC009]
MATEFTRLEFEGGSVIVVTTPQGSGQYTIQGNKQSGWSRTTGIQSQPHVTLVDGVIHQFGGRVKRRLQHTTMDC